jgi:hypothetical protein
MPNERDVERALSVSALNRSEIPQLVVGENDTARVLFSAGGNQNSQGAPGAYYGAIWLSGPLGAVETKVDDAGAAVVTPGPPFTPGAARWPLATRYNNPTSRVAASTSLVLRGPGDNFAEFFIVPRAGMQLCDSTGVGWRYVLDAANTAVDPGISVSLAAQQALIGNPTWFRSDGRTIIGSGRGHGGSLQVKSYASAIQVRWGALATYIQVTSPSGAIWNVQPDTSGVLQVTPGS